MKRLFTQFSFPGGIPSHVAPETPARFTKAENWAIRWRTPYGAVFDNPDLLACCVIGDGEAETGALATSWHSNKFLNPARDGAVLPILHLNGYKIAGPTVLARIPHEELASLLKGYGYQPYFVEGDDPRPGASDHGRHARSRAGGHSRHSRAKPARSGFTERRMWPMIVLRTPKGWTGPKVVDGQTDRRNLPRAPGAARRTGNQAGAHRHARRVDEELPARGVV